MKNFWKNKNLRNMISRKCRYLVVPLLFVVSVVVFVSYFAASYVQATEKSTSEISQQRLSAPRESLVEKIRKADGVRQINADDLKNMMSDDSDLVVINVLSKDWYNKSHIDGSINIPIANKDEFKARIVKKYSKDTPIVVYCASKLCPLSREAYTILVHDLGFTQVWAYEGGIKDWEEHGFEVESND